MTEEDIREEKNSIDKGPEPVEPDAKRPDETPDRGPQKGKRPENKMGTMPVTRLIFSMSAPAIISMMIMALYNVVDSIFVSRLGERALESITIAFPVQLLMISVGVGTGIGINSLIARRLGAREFDQADSAAGNGLRLTLIGGTIFTLFGIFGTDWFMHLFTHNESVVRFGTDYLSIICTFSMAIMVITTTEKIIQATGNMIYPMLSSILGAVVNVVLDPILIFGLLGAPRLEMKGAAIATVTGQLCSMILLLILLFKKKYDVRVNLKAPFDLKIIGEIYKVGAPSIVMQALGSVMQFGMNAILELVSPTAVAVMGVYGRLQSFVFMPVFGIGQGSMPVMGFNYGARNKKRLIKAFKVAFAVSFCIMLCGLLVFQIFPEQLLAVFDASDKMYEIGVPAFRIVSICFIPASFGITTSNLFQATGHGMLSLFASFIRQMIGILPLAYMFYAIGRGDLVWWAFALAEILGTAYAIIMLRYLYKNKISKLDTI